MSDHPWLDAGCISAVPTGCVSDSECAAARRCLLRPDPDQRRGDWIQVYSGRPFWPLDPRPDEVHIEDIAHALALKCRYGGHSLTFYSVAEHSVLVSRHVAPEHALWGLLHDAAEAYLADIPRPVKRDLQGWHAIEAAVMRAVCLRFGMALDEPPEVKHIDLAITTDEKDAIMCRGPEWSGLLPPIGADIQALLPHEAERAFLQRFAELTA